MKDENSVEPAELEVRIYSIATSLTESIIFLDEIGGTRILPIWIGPMEAQAIAIRLSGYPSPRPMTHDLFYSFIRALDYTVEKVRIVDITDNTYYSVIQIADRNGDNRRDIDSRPSDAIALAVRFGCRIFISERVFEKAQVLSKPITEDEVARFKQDLNKLKPNDIISQLLNNRGRAPKKDAEEEEGTGGEGEGEDEQA